MDIFENTKKDLEKIWADADARQNSKIVLLRALGESSDIPVKVALEVLDELDRLLLKPEETKKSQVNRGL